MVAIGLGLLGPNRRTHVPSYLFVGMLRLRLLDIERRPRTFVVFVVDLFAILVVIGWGLTTHAVDPLGQPDHLLKTAAPFLVGWCIASPTVGAYSKGSLRNPIQAVGATAVAWMLGVLIGGMIRATGWLPGGAPLVFLLVLVAAGLLLLLPVRVLGIVVRRKMNL